MLKGEAQAVQELYETIKKDVRRKDVNISVTADIKEKNFKECALQKIFL